MKEALVLLIALFMAEGPSEPTANDSISERYSTILSNHNREIHDAVMRRAPRVETRRLAETRQAELHTLIAEGLLNSEKMTALDWAALAMAAEHVSQRDECIKYASRAIELAPETTNAYMPLMRSLLNANRIDDAESLLISAKINLDDATIIHAMHHLLSSKYRKQEQWAKAASHTHIFLEAAMFERNQNLTMSNKLSRTYREYLTLMQNAGQEEQGRSQLHSWSRACADKIESLSNDDASGASELWHCAALCEVRCEIAKCLPEPAYDDNLVFWARMVYHPRWNLCGGTRTMQQTYLGDYIEFNADKVVSWTNVAAEFSQLSTDHFAVGNEEQNEIAISNLSKLQEFANRQVSGESSDEDEDDR